MEKRKRIDFNQVVGFLAFVGLLAIAVSMVITNIFSKANMEIIRTISTIAMYVVLGTVSFYFCSTRNNPIYFGLWSVTVILIILSYVL